MKIKVKIDIKFLESCGTNTLQGAILKQIGYSCMPTEVELIFPHSSSAWREKNGGPRLWIMPEYAPYCLLESILRLQAQGVTILLKTEEDQGDND